MNMENTAFLAGNPNRIADRQIYLLRLLGLAALYALLAKVVLVYFSANGVVSIVWPPSGLAMAVLIMGGKRYAPGVFLGALIANVMTGLHPGIAAAIAVGNTLEALIGAWLLTHPYFKFDSKIKTLNDYLKLIVLGGLIAGSVSALNGSTTLLLSGFLTVKTYLPNLINWWMGDILGVILIASLILTWRRLPDDWFKSKRMAEVILLLGMMFLANQIVFLGWFHDPAGVFEQIAKGYWMFLFITIVAVRLGIHVTMISLSMTTIQALSGATLGVGFFANDIVKTYLVSFWFYIVVLSAVGMALATYFEGLKVSEKELNNSKEDLERMLDSMAEGAYGLDINGNCTFANKACLQLLGYQDVNELLGKHMHDIIHHSHADGSPYPVNKCKICSSFKTCLPVNVSDEVFWRKDGTAIPVEYWSHPIIKDGIVLGAINTFIDIAERKQNMEKLRRSNADLEQFAYATAHDMRQPLRMITSYLQLIEEELSRYLTGEIRQNFRFATEGAKHMDELLAALLDYSTIGSTTKALKEINTGEALNEALQYLKPAIEESKAELTIKGTWPRLLADRHEMVRLFQNLIENALKYKLGDRKPEILLSARTEGGEWRFEVSDNGVGLIPGQEKRLFKVFERLYPRSHYTGTGIGLALCRKIVEHHGGRIWVESPGENKGCTFIFTIPNRPPLNPLLN